MRRGSERRCGPAAAGHGRASPRTTPTSPGHAEPCGRGDAGSEAVLVESIAMMGARVPRMPLTRQPSQLSLRHDRLVREQRMLEARSVDDMLLGNVAVERDAPILL